MFLFELTSENEAHPAYQELAVGNLARQYDLLRSLVQVSLTLGQSYLSTEVIRSLNFQAIGCLHAHAGDLRPCEVTVGPYNPPAFHRVPALMAIMVNEVNRYWEPSDPVGLATYVLWRLNWIHPFVNGNGRTARVVAYFILCLKFNAWLPGTSILPDLLRRERTAYVHALRHADTTYAGGTIDLQPLHNLVTHLLDEQLNPPPAPLAVPPAP